MRRNVRGYNCIVIIISQLEDVSDAMKFRDQV